MIIPCNLPNTPLFGTQNSPLLLYVHQIGAEEFNAKNLLAHKHDNFELMLCLNGTSTFLIDGKTYPVRKNDLIVYNRGVLHDEHAQQSYLDILCFGARGIRMPGRSPDAVTGPGTSPIIHCGRYSAYIRHLFQSMVTYSGINTPAEKAISYSCMYSLLNFVYASGITDREPGESQSDSVLCEQIEAWLADNYLKPVSIDDLAEIFGYSRNHIARTFHSKRGISPKQYLTGLRLGRAQSLLIHTTRTISDIALSSGYQNFNSFYYAFVKQFGISPRQFRETYASHVSKNLARKKAATGDGFYQSKE